MKDHKKPFGRSVKYVVLPVEAVRAMNIRSNEEVVEAQKGVSEEMLRALEEMVNSARANKLETTAALAMAAVAW